MAQISNQAVSNAVQSDSYRESESLYLAPISEISRLINARVSDLNNRPVLTDQEVENIVNSSPGMPYAVCRVANRIWEISGRKVSDLETPLKHTQLALQMLEDVKAGKKFSYPQAEDSQLSIQIPETELFMFGDKQDVLNVAAIPRNVIAGIHSKRNELSSSYGLVQSNIMINGDGEFYLEVKFMEKGQKGTIKILDINDVYTEYGGGLLGVIPFIEPSFRKDVLEWNEGNQTENELKEVFLSKAVNKGLRAVPLELHQFVTADQVSTFNKPYQDVLKNNQFKLDDGTQLIGMFHTHIRESYTDNGNKMMDQLSTSRDPRSLLTPGDWKSYMDTNPKAESFGTNELVAVPVYGVALVEGGRVQDNIALYRSDGMENLRELNELARNADNEMTVSIQDQGGGIKGLDALQEFYEHIDNNTFDMKDIPFIDI